MTDAFVGAAPEQLEDLASRFRVLADQLRTTQTEIDGLARAVPWDGADAHRFLVAWEGRGAVVLRTTADRLTNQAEELAGQATGQRQASAAAGTVGRAAPGAVAAVGAGVGSGAAPGAGNAPPVAPTSETWRDRAYERAGIDPTTWVPGRGLDANEATVRKVYDYYGALYERDPAAYQWAGMAKLAGATFYGGWQDLEALAKVADQGARAAALHRLLDPLVPPGTPGVVVDRMVEVLAGITQDEIHDLMSLFFLPMHRDIFDDMAWMHEAYDAGGMAEMRRLDRAGELAPGMLAAWRLIDSGDPAKVAEGNRRLLHREQHDVIQAAYDAMYRHDQPIGQMLTQLMTWVGESPIPGGRAYRDVVTQFVGFDLPGARFGVRTPDSLPGIGLGIPSVGVDVATPEVTWGVRLPRGNIAHFDDRWQWIERDMLPAYRRFVAEHPDRMHDLMRTPIAQLAHDKRMAPWLPYR